MISRPLDISRLAFAYAARRLSPVQVAEETLRRIAAYPDPAVWITRVAEDAVMARAKALADTGPEKFLSLYGIPFAVKDNIDVAGLPTTAACPAFAYDPGKDATCVARLRRAGAIVIGKTNLDQFATGLVGVRSPYGVPRNPFNPALIPGGSSSGSAVAVAAGLVPLALGTDTAGSGRVPAGLNNIVGLKPSLGLVSTSGVVPACRSLDCVSIFTLTADDAYRALSVMAAPDETDPYSRAIPVGALSELPPTLTIGVPRGDGLKFFGDKRSEAAFQDAMTLLQGMGIGVVEIDASVFLQTARLLYDGPWAAERWAAVGDFIAQHSDDIHPVTRAIISSGKDPSAADAFKAFYQLTAYRKAALQALTGIDALMVPTVPAAYTVAELAADPVRLNSNLGVYTNGVNLLDLCAFAVPATFASDGTPFGVTFVAPSGQDAFLASLGRAVHARTGLPLGALDVKPAPPAKIPSTVNADEIAIAVVGAHLSGMPLNGELRALGGRFLEKTATAPDYKLFALDSTRPPKPGLLRVSKGKGAPIEIEIWALSAGAFGRFVANIPAPLGIGTLTLPDGRGVKGFLVEAEAVNGAHDISHFGGWRAYLAEQKASA
jgi:allophanate hydrolase